MPTGTIVLLTLTLFVVWPLQAKDIDFQLVNQSGYSISRVWIAKHQTKIWGHSLLKEPLTNGASARISAANASGWNLWDLRIEYLRPKKSWELFTEGFELPKIARIILSIEEDKRWRAHYENSALNHSNGWVRNVISTREGNL